MNIGVECSQDYLVECYGQDGRLKWRELVHNLAVTAGLNDSLDKQFKAVIYTAAWYVGLTAAAPVFAPGDTMGLHPGWTEDTNYTEAVRQTLTLGAIAGGSVNNSGAKAVFSINANGTIGGALITSSNVKGGAAGTLYGGGAFTGGDRVVLNGDILQVTVTLTRTAA